MSIVIPAPWNPEVPFLFGIFLALLFSGTALSAGPGPQRYANLPPCPGSPNCVSSQAPDASHRVDPIPIVDDPAASWSRLVKVIGKMKGARIVEEGDGYLHAEFRSALFGFVDDVEFRMDSAGTRIDLRSASRKGYYDFGANRRRVEEIRARFSREP
jgi:uncharacterized protein (DUF1499 family)